MKRRHPTSNIRRVTYQKSEDPEDKYFYPVNTILPYLGKITDVAVSHFALDGHSVTG
jgi:hypothetical protein